MSELKFQYDILQQTRENILSVIKPLSVDQLNLIPPGFNNNIIWNVAHLMVTQQLLVHKMSAAEMYISDEEIGQFRKGTKPERTYSESEINDIKERLLSIVYKSYKAYSNGQLGNYKEYATSYGVTLCSSEQAITFNNAHEGLHFGSVLALKKLV